MENYLDELNEQQRDAVTYVDGASLVIAGAGSGKTRVLTYKILHLLHLGYDPHRILALTFTNKAAREMRERMARLEDVKLVSRIWMGTFHSIFLRILRSNSDKIGFNPTFTIYDAADSKALIKVIIKEFGLDDKYYRPGAVQSAVSRLKNALLSPKQYRMNPKLLADDAKANVPEFHRIYSEYWRRCKSANAMDFDDILFYTNILFRDNPDILDRYQNFFQYILVDEYQDTNFAQHLIVKQLCARSNKLCVVGDDAQSIYSFRGANIDNILNLHQQFPELRTFKLEQNYRSTQTIINAANSIISNNQAQIHKEIFSSNAKGQPIAVIESYSGYEESYAIANKIIEIKRSTDSSYDDFAILYRTNAQSRLFEESLRKRNIPYRIYGGLSFYQRKEVKDVISYLRIAVNPTDDEAFRRIINTPARGIGETTLKKIQATVTHHEISMWQAISDVHIDEIGLNSGTKKKVLNFRSILQQIIDANNLGTDAETITRTVIRETGLITSLMTENTPENISRQENISELVSNVADFVCSRREEGNEHIQLIDFLSEISLATDQDSENEAEDGARVTLMTVHAAKGLEFRNVFIVGLEEELFPSALSSGSIRALEEERRLMYVAVTRAKEICVLSHANTRFVNGNTKLCSPSRFLREIDAQYLSGLKQRQEIPARKTVENRYSFDTERAIYNHHPSHNTATGQKPKIPASTPTTSPVGEFDIRSASELTVGMKIAHSRFGNGIITKIDTDAPEHKIEVNFQSLGTKTLLLKFAKIAIL